MQKAEATAVSTVMSRLMIFLMVSLFMGKWVYKLKLK